MRRYLSIGQRWLGVAVMLALLGACGGEQAIAPIGRKAKAPPRTVANPRVSSPQTHSVRKGESLYAIAWVYGLDYRDIAIWNKIVDPFTIYPGQRLVLYSSPKPAKAWQIDKKVKPQVRATEKRKTAPPVPRPQAKPTVKASGKPVVRPAAKVAASAPKTENVPVKTWRWPAKGKLIGRFNKHGGKGINILGRRGQPIYTAAPGRVVYSGSGLRGYGKLIIVKHNKRFLSAYAHNQRLRVQEGDRVGSGQQIAEMGNSESREIKLHFEIRRDGKPVNPTRYLP